MYSGRCERLSCDDCEMDSTGQIKLSRGCNGMRRIPKPYIVDDEVKEIFVDGTYKKILYVTEIWSCPVKLIPGSILSFFRNYQYYSKHPSAPFPKRKECNPKYLKAESIFEGYLNSIR